MSAKYIVNQDRDQTYNFDPEALFYPARVVHDGIDFGYNLMMGNTSLGTFETLDAIVEEVREIYNSPQEKYFVSGYSGWRAGI